MEKKKKRPVLNFIKVIFKLILAVALIWVACLVVITITEYKPADEETLEVTGQGAKQLSEGDQITVMTWNIGYGALGDNADFFMDGGKGVNTASSDRIHENISNEIEVIKDINPDVIFLQETDRDSKRSHYVDEFAEFETELGTDRYESVFACNYNVLYIPYPIPTIGKVYGGIGTFSSFEISDSKRISLPCPFGYPLRVAQLKRCLNVNRCKIEGSDRELVLVNLHLEAYDSGEGKIAQTKVLKELLEKEAKAGNYVVAGGDFNQVFSNIDMSKYPVINDKLWTPGSIETEEFEGLVFLSDASSPTCRSLDKPYEGADKDNFQYYMIDGFIVSDNISVDEIKTVNLDFKNSDHNPVTLKITLK